MTLEPALKKLLACTEDNDYGKWTYSPSGTPLRIFENDFLEKCTKTNLRIIATSHSILILISMSSCLWVGIPNNAYMYLLLGIIFWGMFEYYAHRYIFHFIPSSEFGNRVHFMIHGLHHKVPSDVERLLIPLPVGLAIGVIFIVTHTFLFGVHGCMFAIGFVFGYLVYDLTHYSIHAYNFDFFIFQYFKKRHHFHHYDENGKESNFAISLFAIPWDIVNNTDKN